MDGKLSQAYPLTELFVINVRTGKTNKLPSQDTRIDHLSYLPNNELLFMAEHSWHQHGEESDQTWVKILNINSHQLTTLATFQGLQQVLQPKVSADGTNVAITYDADYPVFDSMLSLGFININTKILQRLTKDINWRNFQWSKDGKYLYAIRAYGYYHQLYKINIKSGDIFQLTFDAMNIERFRISPDGSQVALMAMDAHGTRYVRICDVYGKNIQDIITEPSIGKEFSLSSVQEIAWKVPDYPAPMRGLLFLPLNYDKTKAYPLIIDIHGGGVGASGYLGGALFVLQPLEPQLWTSKGYAVLLPELRSSMNFGNLALSRDELQEHNLINCDIMDIIAGAKTLADKGIVDLNRIFAIGHSAGGRRINWLTVATHFFKAVVSKEGWADDWFETGTCIPSMARINFFY